MRPQHDAADNVDAMVASETEQLASMRPQHDAADNQHSGIKIKQNAASFNEAAARCCG